MGSKMNWLGRRIVNYLARREDLAKSIVDSLGEDVVKGSGVYEKREREHGAEVSGFEAQLIMEEEKVMDLRKKLKEGREEIGGYIESASELSDRIHVLEGELEREREKLSDVELITRVGELEGRLQERDGDYYNLTRQNEYLAEAKKRMVVELAMARLERGGDPKHYNCPETARRIAMMNKEMRGELNEKISEISELRRGIERLSSSYYERFFDLLEMSGQLGGEFALAYIDEGGRISRVSKNMSGYTGIDPDMLLGVKVISLARKTNRKDLGKVRRDWAVDNERYQTMHLDDKTKIDVLAQRVNDPEGDSVGTFLYVAKHNYLFKHKGHETVNDTVHGFGEGLENLFKGYCKIPYPAN